MAKTVENAHHKAKTVMVFFDGTWCGQLTDTDTNVKILADTVAGKKVEPRVTFVSERYPSVVGVYFDGEGVDGTFSDYILDGALGGKIKEDCLEAYKFLMDEFEKSDSECEGWLIGLSRGSYTVRCVAGMINNCGLISRKVLAERLKHDPSPVEVEDVINRAYDYYRDRSDTYFPNSEFMKKWKQEHSRETERPPIKFMGLFETVGSLGIPSLNPGQGVDYNGALNFHGKPEEGASAVSGEVERVYQALAVHDRLTVFSPCHVKRDKTNEEFSYNKEKKLNIEYECVEMWFPGAHYDIGRQKFMFYKSPKVFTGDLKEMPTTKQKIAEVTSRLCQCSLTFFLTRILRIPDIEPNYEFSRDVLEWMLKKMSSTDPDTFGTLQGFVGSKEFIQKTQPDYWHRLRDQLTGKPEPLHNDAYDHLMDKEYLSLQLLPFAHRFLVGMFNRYFLKDRTISDPPPSTPPAPRVEFHLLLHEGGKDSSYRNLKASKKYRSRSFDSYWLQRKIERRRHPIETAQE